MEPMHVKAHLNELQDWLLEYGRGFLQDPASRQQARLSQVQQALLEQQIAWRYRSRFRFPEPERWLWSDRSLAQSSDWLSAAFKASLFPPDELVVDGCCGAGVDTVALALRGPVIAIDCDPWLVALAQNNTAAHDRQICTYAERLSEASIRGAKWLHADPDRRLDQAKTLRADEFSPSIDELSELFKHVAGGMIKIAPSTEFSEHTAAWIDQQGCRAWIGNYGECRQQLLLVGQILQQGLLQQILLADSVSSVNARIAVVLSAAQGAHTSLSHGFQWQAFASAPLSFDRYPASTQNIGPYVFDLHATLHAAELQPAWAALNNLQAITDVRGYFTSDKPMNNSMAQCFEVIDVVPWDDRKMRKWLRERDVGNVEIKCRLIRLDASDFQRRYSGQKGPPVTILVTRVGHRVRGIICRRYTS